HSPNGQNTATGLPVPQLPTAHGGCGIPSETTNGIGGTKKINSPNPEGTGFYDNNLSIRRCDVAVATKGTLIRKKGARFKSACHDDIQSIYLLYKEPTWAP
ncbi:hypothetical protein ACVBEJ_06575, partial [Porticoccus sp. GXU_MW_L64]